MEAVLGSRNRQQGKMMVESNPVKIKSTEYWFKIIEMLQQNWALIDAAPSGEGCTVFFVGDTSGVFDRVAFASVAEAEAGLRRNGFTRFAKNKRVQELLFAPQPPFHEQPHPNGPIYSSGKFWIANMDYPNEQRQ